MPAQALGEPAGTDPPVPFGPAGTDPEQVLKLIVRTTDNNPTFQIPTCSYLNGTYGGKPYNWAIDWGDGATEVRSGTSSQYGGIPHTYASAGDYTITITPNGSVEAWLGAFGFGTGFIGVNEIANKRMIISVPSLLTPQMTRTTAQIDGKEPAPDSEWYYTFDYCVYLTEAQFSQVGRALEMWEITSLKVCFLIAQALRICPKASLSRKISLWQVIPLLHLCSTAATT